MLSLYHKKNKISFTIKKKAFQTNKTAKRRIVIAILNIVKKA